MAGDKTAVEGGLTKHKPISYSKASLNPDSVHCIRSSNKHEEQEKQQNNSIHIKYPKNSETSQVTEHQFRLYYGE